MSKFFLQILPLASSMCILFCYSCCFALDSKEFPWYFEPNQVKKCWEKTKGNNMIIDVIDTEVKFVSTLKDKEYASISYLKPNHRAPTEKEKNHGTAVASLIVGDTAKLVCPRLKKPWCDKQGKAVVAGIAPGGKIISRVWKPDGDLEKAVVDALYMEERIIPKDGDGSPVLKVDRKIKLILLNISGGTKSSEKETALPNIERTASDLDIEDWLDRIKRNARNNPYFLIVASVGNDGKKLDGKNGVIPAIVPAPSRRSRIRDPIIRVAAVEVYNSKEEPQRWSGSNYGKDFVDIMAPGSLIPVLTPESKASIDVGTSLATAITSGALALLASCNYRATADHLKQILLNNSDEYSHLNHEVMNGRVLNIYKVINKYCKEDDLFVELEEGVCYPENDVCHPKK